MSRIRLNWWGIPALVVLFSLGILWPAWAQHPSDRSAGDLMRAREMVALIEQGQIDLTSATKIAEKHVDGSAVRAECEIRDGGGTSGDSAGSSAVKSRSIARHLVYSVTCFAKDKGEVQAVQVDGLTKKVIEVD